MRVLIFFVLWWILFAISWPIAIVALLLLPVVYLVALPFRLAAACVGALFGLIRVLLFLPARVLGYRRAG